MFRSATSQEFDKYYKYGLTPRALVSLQWRHMGVMTSEINDFAVGLIVCSGVHQKI